MRRSHGRGHWLEGWISDRATSGSGGVVVGDGEGVTVFHFGELGGLVRCATTLLVAGPAIVVGVAVVAVSVAEGASIAVSVGHTAASWLIFVPIPIPIGEGELVVRLGLGAPLAEVHQQVQVLASFKVALH